MNSMKHKTDSNTARIKKWLARNPSGNGKRLRKILKEQGHNECGLTNVLHAAEFSSFRRDLLRSRKK
jgi:hypothetical protein